MKKENFIKCQKLFTELDQVNGSISYLEKVCANKEEGLYEVDKMQVIFYEIEEIRRTINIPPRMFMRGKSKEECHKSMLEEFIEIKKEIEDEIEKL